MFGYREHMRTRNFDVHHYTFLKRLPIRWIRQHVEEWYREYQRRCNPDQHIGLARLQKEHCMQFCTAKEIWLQKKEGSEIGSFNSDERLVRLRLFSLEQKRLKCFSCRGWWEFGTAFGNGEVAKQFSEYKTVHGRTFDMPKPTRQWTKCWKVNSADSSFSVSMKMTQVGSFLCCSVPQLFFPHIQKHPYCVDKYTTKMR